MTQGEVDKVIEGLSFATKIKARRAELGFSLRDVEQITKEAISNGYLSQLENGKISNPSVHVVLCLCAAYGVVASDALSWLQFPVEIPPPRLCGECGRALPPQQPIEEQKP